MSDTHLYRHASASFSTVKLRVAAQNYYNPFGPCGSPNRLPDSVLPSQVPCEGLELEIDNYRYHEFPRIVENDGNVLRLLTGLRGQAGRWDWEGAVVWSRAQKDDLTRNRVSNLLMVEALSDPTPEAYNPFSGGVNSNIERALVDVYRKQRDDARNGRLPGIYAGTLQSALGACGAGWPASSFAAKPSRTIAIPDSTEPTFSPISRVTPFRTCRT